MKLAEGDLTLFCAHGRVISSAAVTLRTQNEALAKQLWGVDERGSTWEYMYFLRGFRELDIPVRDLNLAAGYAENNVVQGFSVLDFGRSQSVIRALQLWETISESEFSSALQALDDGWALDAQRSAIQRTEQSYIRQQMLGGMAEAACAICGRSFPVDLLVCAHIKRRADCSDEEKRAVHLNVVPMCRFGCDELFERGYVTVPDGRVRVHRPNRLTSAVEEYLLSVKGKRSEFWSEERAPFFRWHHNRIRQG